MIVVKYSSWNYNLIRLDSVCTLSFEIFLYFSSVNRKAVWQNIRKAHLIFPDSEQAFMAWWNGSGTRAFAAKTDILSLIPGFHMMEGEKLTLTEQSHGCRNITYTVTDQPKWQCGFGNFLSQVPRWRDTGYNWLFRERILLFSRDETVVAYPNPSSQPCTYVHMHNTEVIS